MAFDTTTRNRLASFVAAARGLIADEFTEQFQSLYGISATGDIAPLDRLSHLDEEGLGIAARLRERIDYLIKNHPHDRDGAKVAVARLAREQAFTVLNRLAAVRMTEKRGIIVESVGKGYQSKGFKVFETVAGSALGDTYHRYRCYLFCLFDELAVDLGVLFSRRSLQSLIFPRETALLELLGLLNAPALEGLWAEDETIGWIYQYYNDQAERKKMRDESSAPRNSRELAVRNQFFTPRYVVEFLNDNTLGRIWYEMTQGDTTLKEQCRYLVRRPTEIFLSAGEAPPAPNQEPENKNEELSQEDLLKQPLFIPHRPLKDPRTILMLDPACGSMHFGLYAFDLFEVIYDEAWALEEKLGPDALSRPPGMKSLHANYAGKDAFLKDVPRLIIEHNLHGIDIDPRCAQIAGLSLWLRAQKAWQRLGLKQAERPAIKRSNIVCAEPMPGEKELLREFVEREFPAEERAVCLRLLEAIFDKMQLAGEAGSLLKIEEEIRSSIEDARDAWNKLAAKPPELFTTTELNQLSTAPELTGLEQAVSSLTTGPRHLTTDFWERIEERIYAALRDYAEQAENGGGFQRRLFAEDAARGFAFIDVCRKRYDVAVMNPPFGYPSERSKTYVDDRYEHAKYDVLAAFIDRGCEWLVPDGYIGCIASRTVFFIEFFDCWRQNLFQNLGLQFFVDLGFGVLEALVETAAFTIQKGPSTSAATFVRLLSSPAKDTALALALQDLRDGIHVPIIFSEKVSNFLHIDGCPLAYWVAKSFRSHFGRHPTVNDAVGEVRQGLITGDDFRFFRTTWEVDAKDKGERRKWVFLAKGGEFRKYYDDLHLLVNWWGDGAEIINFVDDNGKQRSRPQNSSCYYRPGITAPMRTTSNFSPRLLPSGCIFNVQGTSVFGTENDTQRLLATLAVLSSAAFESFTRLKARVGDMTSAGGAGFTYTPGLIGSMPFPTLEVGMLDQLAEIATRCVVTEQSKDTKCETSAIFVNRVLVGASNSLRNAFEVALKQNEEADLFVLESSLAIEERVQEAYKFSDADALEVLNQFGQPVAALVDTAVEDTSFVERLYKKGISVGEKTSTQASQKRQLSSDRHLRIDEICDVARISPRVFILLRQQRKWIRDEELVNEVSEIMGYLVGVAFGRWDIRYATGEQAAPELPDPFAPLPVCPPGQLQNAQGLPARPEDVPAAYPVRIPWDGILVDDPNHPLDLERRVREVIEIIWSGQEGGPTAEAIEHEACEILGVKSLRDYFRKPTGFFADHLKRYSKSRRQAPIYWPLATASGSYTLWIYYHRLTDQTLHTCLADFLDPKIRQVQADLDSLSGQSGTRAEELREFRDELKNLHDEIERTIKLPWKPNLNDGVLITASPLHSLFRLPKWKKDLKACWDELAKGDYDWAHLAYSIWPQRVEKACERDRSLAIAHGLEHLCKVEPPKPKAKRAAKKAAILKESNPDLPVND